MWAEVSQKVGTGEFSKKANKVVGWENIPPWAKHPSRWGFHSNQLGMNGTDPTISTFNDLVLPAERDRV